MKFPVIAALLLATCARAYDGVSVYGGVSGTDRGSIMYLGGARYDIGRFGGFGAEYRRFRPGARFTGNTFGLDTRAAGVYAYVNTSKRAAVRLGLEGGASVVWDEGAYLDLGETWCASGRLALTVSATRFFDIVLWGGALRLGEFSVASGNVYGRIPEQTYYEGVAAVRMNLSEFLNLTKSLQ